MKKTILLYAAIAALFAMTPIVFGGQIYKCVLDGKTTFSQRPCDGDISTITIKGTGTATESQADYKKKNKALDEAINQRRADRRLRGLKQDLEILKKQRDREIASIRSQMRNALTKADVLILQQHIANRRTEWNERISEKQREIKSAGAPIGPGGS